MGSFWDELNKIAATVVGEDVWTSAKANFRAAGKDINSAKQGIKKAFADEQKSDKVQGEQTPNQQEGFFSKLFDSFGEHLWEGQQSSGGQSLGELGGHLHGALVNTLGNNAGSDDPVSSITAAIERGELYVEGDNPPMSLLRLRAGFLREYGSLVEAVADLTAHIESKLAGLHYAHFERGYALMQLGDASKAASDFDLALQLAAKEGDPAFILEGAYFARALARTELGDMNGALEDYGECIRRNPRSIDPYMNRGHVYCDYLENYQAATDDFTLALSLAQDASQRAMALANLGEAQTKSGMVEEAEKALAEAIKLDPTGPAGQAARGQLARLRYQR